MAPPRAQTILLLVPWLGACAHAPGRLGAGELGRYLQRFVDDAYARAFRHLGDERDFDHGHLLFARGAARPVAILYHTQELARYEDPAGGYGYLDPEGRNWLQWLSDGRVENARRYERARYPEAASWELFRELDLPDYETHRTLTHRMLDPGLLGVEIVASRQWVFTRASCGRGTVRIRLPEGGTVCLRFTLPES